jgi:trehalose 6-phosphate phosphatase
MIGERRRVKPEAELQIEAFLRSVAGATRSLLLLDYDGTLGPFRRERAQAVPYAGVSQLLEAITGTGRTRVVIISGRDAKETIELLGVQPSLEIWGLHGLQRVLPNGASETMQLDECAQQGLDAAERWLDYQQLRSTAEFKALSIAVHWRGLDASEAEEIRGRTLMGWNTIAETANLGLLEFDGGVEILPLDADKGNAVRTLLNEMDPDAPVAYLGDDLTDESAFRAVNPRGLSILVRPRSRRTAAVLWLKPPEELLDFLGRWLRACGQEVPSGSKPVLAVNE